MATTSQRVRFEGAFGDHLAARLEEPADGARAFALFAHCFTCSKDLKSVGWLSRALVDRGIGVLRFDFTGIGESDGDFADTNFSSNLDDLVKAAEFLRRELAGPRILIGHSLGGSAVLAVARRIPEATAVATLGAPSDPRYLRNVVDGEELASQGQARINLAGRSFLVREQLFDDLEEQNLKTAIAQLKRALLILHSPVDTVVGIDHARRIFDAARHPKSFVSLDSADHLLLSHPRDARYAADVLATWASRYIDPEPTEARPGEVPPPGEVWVRGGKEGLAQQIQVGEHTLAADEPVPLGGTDTGPNPYDFLLASLGACTSMTLRMYADRKGWPLDGVAVRLRHAKIHAQDCAECETEKGKVDLIEREIELAGPLDEAQESRLMEIADRCPVHRTLSSEIRIRSRSG